MTPGRFDRSNLTQEPPEVAMFGEDLCAAVREDAVTSLQPLLKEGSYRHDCVIGNRLTYNNMVYVTKIRGVYLLLQFLFLGGRDSHQRTPPVQGGAEWSVRLLLTLPVPSGAPWKGHGTSIERIPRTGRLTPLLDPSTNQGVMLYNMY